MRVIAITKVITESERAERSCTIQPGNHEWITVIETVSACDITISSLIIFKAVIHQTAWYKNGSLPHDWLIGVSENGWMNNKIGLT